MTTEKVPPGQIINKWKKENFVGRTSPRGTTYLILSNSSRMEALAILAKSFRDNGYTYDEMNHYKISTLIADTCWRSDKIVNMSTSETTKAKFSVTVDWQETIDGMYSEAVISKLEEHEKPVFKIEPKVEIPFKSQKPFELNPSDRIVMDTSDMSECPIDEEIAAELAAIGTFLKEDE